MKIVKKERSAESCAEAGWIGWDYETKEPLQKEWILSLRTIGNLTYLTMLREPFFKAESDYYLVRGTEGKRCFRIGIHASKLEELEALEEKLEKLS